MILRKLDKYGTVVGAMTGAMLLALAQGAMAQSTQSPEGFGVEATGPASVPPTPEATATDPTPPSLASVDVPGTLAVNTAFAQVSRNTTIAGVAGVTALSGAPVAVSSDLLDSACTANPDGTFTESASLVHLTIPGLTIPANPAPNTTLSIPGVVTAILNQQVAGPIAGSQTVNALVLHFPATGEDIYLGSSTCGPYKASNGKTS
jgi:hypothetical protein